MESYAYWVATGAAFVVSAFCSVAEGALLSYLPSRLEESLKDARSRERVCGYLAEVDRYLFSALVLNAISDVVLVFACTLGFLPHGSIYALVVSLLVVIVGAEVVPRAFATHYAEALLPRVLPPIALADRVLFPLIRPLRALDRTIRRALGSDEKERRAAEIVDELRSAAIEGEREGVLGPQGAEMIESIIDFHDVEVREVMTPRTEMIMLEASTPLTEAAKIAVERGHNRIPVYEGTRDRVIGILYAKDLLRFYQAGGPKQDKQPTLKALLRKPFFVPETKQIGQLLKEFRTRKVHVAVVLDEYGGTAGLVTIEDVIEQIVGEIEDEFTEGPSDQPQLTRIDERTAEIDARVKIGEINERLSLDIPEVGAYETLGGFLFFHMGKVPKRGEKLSHKDLQFTVLDADERRIRRVRVEVGIPQPPLVQAGEPGPRAPPAA